jgi:hypothetical protein
MNYTIFTLLALGLEVGAYAQGGIALDNISNASASPSPVATTSGLFWISTGGPTVLITNDFNAAFYAGADAGSLSPLATFLLSNGTAAGDNAGGPGTFADPHGNDYTILGTGANTLAFFQIQAWTGNFNSYAAAVAAGVPAAQSPVFVNPVSIPPGPAPSLYGMPAIVMSTVPEPSTFALAGLSALCLLLFRNLMQKR